MHSIPHVKMKVRDLLPNPHRDLETNPIKQEKVEDLIASIGRTGFWDNLLVRPSPNQKGKYEIAYGHNRLAALTDPRVSIKEVTLPVAELSEWEMYLAMVDENETQQEITPAIVQENVGVGAALIEQYIRESETAEEFQAHFANTAGGVSNLEPDVYGKMRARVLRGEGPGAETIIAYVPTSRVHKDLIREVLRSIYGEKQAEAKRKDADAKEAEARAKRKQADAEKDAKHAEQLRREAQKAEAEAKAFEEEADKASRMGIAKEILLLMPTPEHIRVFAQTARSLGIPHDRQMEIAKKVSVNDWSKRALPTEMEMWWDQASGAYAKRLRESDREKANKKIQQATRGGDVNAFLMKVTENVTALRRDLVMAVDVAEFASDGVRRALQSKVPEIIELLEKVVERAGAPDASTVVDVTPRKTEMLTHQEL